MVLEQIVCSFLKLSGCSASKVKYLRKKRYRIGKKLKAKLWRFSDNYCSLMLISQGLFFFSSCPNTMPGIIPDTIPSDVSKFTIVI